MSGQARTSAGLLPVHRACDGSLRVFIAHMGGPLWSRKTELSWSVVKGLYDVASEDALAAARREFAEETGAPAPPGEPVDLGEFRLPSGKRLRVFAVLVADPSTVEFVASNEFEMEWPPRSGAVASFPEVQTAAWVSLTEARRLLVKGQHQVLDAVSDHFRPTR